jgi:adenylate kinase family enzyme
MTVFSSPPFPIPGSRIAITGTTGSGKTTLGDELGQILGIPHIELDAIFWQPGWVEREREEFHRLAADALSIPAWVVDGNYRSVRDLTWGQADTLVWLDYPFFFIFFRLLFRTLKRIRTKEELWGYNVETYDTALFSRDSIIVWFLKTYWRRKREMPLFLKEPRFSHLQVIRLRSQKDKDQWLEVIRHSVQTPL